LFGAILIGEAFAFGVLACCFSLFGTHHVEIQWLRCSRYPTPAIFFGLVGSWDDERDCQRMVYQSIDSIHVSVAEDYCFYFFLFFLFDVDVDGRMAFSSPTIVISPLPSESGQCL
jgi:hypothetical protein